MCQKNWKGDSPSLLIPKLTQNIQFVKSGQKIWAGPSPPPHLDKIQKNSYFFSENLPWEWNKNLNESAHFIASVFLSSKVVQNYIRPPNLDKIDYISYFWLILRNPRVLQLFMIVHLIIWEPCTWNVTEILWFPPQFMKQLYLNPNFRTQLQLKLN